MNVATAHLSEGELALFASGDLSLWRAPKVRWHLSRCPECEQRAEVYQSNRRVVRDLGHEIPAGVNWERLSAEMSANIRVGLAAGECVAPQRRERAAFSMSTGRLSIAWRVAGASLGFTALLMTAWWLNTPARETQALGNALKAIASRPLQTRGWGTGRFMSWEEQGSVVRASAQGIELRENGSLLGVSQGTDRPVAVTLSVKGSAHARYVDEDTGQVTITSVYAQ